MKIKSRVRTTGFLVLMGTVGASSQLMTAQENPTSAAPSRQDELDRLRSVMLQLSSNSCQNINAAALIIESDPKSAALVSQTAKATQILSSGVTLDEFLHALLAINCLTLKQKEYQPPSFDWTVQKTDVVNAFADSQHHTIVITTGMVNFTRDDPGELAFVVAHELGHLVDQPLGCQAALRRERIATLTQQGAQRQCEARADNVGFQYFVGAHFNPYEAAAYFGRFQMYFGKPGLLAQFAMDHPIDAERIQNLRNLFAKLLQEATENASRDIGR